MRWAPRDNEVFDLVPPTFEAQAKVLWTVIGEPSVSSDNFWLVYGQLLAVFKASPVDPELHLVLEAQSRFNPMEHVVEAPLLPDLAPLRNDRYFAGGGIYLGGAPVDDDLGVPGIDSDEGPDEELDEEPASMNAHAEASGADKEDEIASTRCTLLVSQPNCLMADFSSDDDEPAT